MNHKSNGIDSIIETLNNLNLKLDVPFADLGTGDYLCFTYKNQKDKSPIVTFLDHEEWSNKRIQPIAKSFKQLLIQ